MIGLIKGTMRSKKALAGLPLPIASFRTNGNSPLTACTLSITPVQSGSGDPYPAGGGVNKWDEVWEVGSIDTTTGNNSIDNNVIRSKNYIPCIPNTNYYCTVNPYRWFVYDNNKNFIGTLEGNRAFTTPPNAYFIRFRLYASYGTTYNNDISVNYPSTDTSYHPTANIRPISGWGSVKVSATGKNLCPPLSVETSELIGASYRGRRSVIPQQRCVMSFVDNDDTVDVSGISFGFFDSSYTTGTLSSSQYRWVLQNGVVQSEKRNIPTNLDNSINLDGIFAYPKTEETWQKLMARFYIQIEFGTTVTDYVPYNGQTATIPLPHTVYGGELDVVSGSGSETWGMIKLSDLDWTGIASNPPVFRAVLSSIPNIQAPASNTTVTTAFTESFSAMSYTAITSSNIGKFAISATVSNRVVFIDDSVATLDAFLAKYGNDKLVYPLATPTALATSPVALNARNGTNNVWADAGDISELGYVVRHPHIGR